jgi:hypothetical protein
MGLVAWFAACQYSSGPSGVVLRRWSDSQPSTAAHALIVCCRLAAASFVGGYFGDGDVCRSGQRGVVSAAQVPPCRNRDGETTERSTIAEVRTALAMPRIPGLTCGYTRPGDGYPRIAR